MKRNARRYPDVNVIPPHEVLQTIVQQIHKKLKFNVITFLGKIPHAKEKEELLH